MLVLHTRGGEAFERIAWLCRAIALVFGGQASLCSLCVSFALFYPFVWVESFVLRQCTHQGGDCEHMVICAHVVQLCDE